MLQVPVAFFFDDEGTQTPMLLPGTPQNLLLLRAFQGIEKQAQALARAIAGLKAGVRID